MKKRILIFLLSIITLSAFGQAGSLSQSVYRSRVNDSTTVNGSHASGYGDIYFNNQRAQPAWLFWDAESGTYKKLGSGSGSGGWPLTGTAALTGNTSITGDFGLNLGTATNHLDSFSVYTETRLLLHAQDQMAIDIHDDLTSSIITASFVPSSLTIQAGDAAQTIFQINDQTGGNGFSVSTTGNDISLTAAGAGDINLTGGVVADIVTVNDDAYGAGWNGSGQVPTKNAVYDQVELKSNIASPTFTGTPAAPTAAAGTSTTQIATTAFVQTASTNDWLTLTDGTTVAWDASSKQNPKAKLTSTQSFTLDFQNVVNGTFGLLKITTNTASAITITFDAGYTHKTFNTTFTTYTFPAATAKEYFLSFVVDGTTVEWNIGDLTTISNDREFAFVRRNATQSITNNTIMAVSWDTEVSDNAAIFDSGNPTRFTVPGTGNKIVTVSGFVDYSSNSTALRRVWFYVNGASVTGVAYAQYNANSAVSTTCQFSAMIPCAGGDYVEIMAYQNSGAGLTATAGCTVKIEDY